MKKCPFCGAEIEENARFCLFCMTPLDEKEKLKAPKTNTKQWLYVIIAAVLVVLLIVGSLFAFNPFNTSNKTKDNGASSESGSSLTEASNETVTTDRSENVITSDNKLSSNSSDVKTSFASSGDKASSENKPDTSSKTSSVQSNDRPKATVSYTYTVATLDNTYPLGQGMYAPENAIVITGVSGIAADGVYVIPETIDGKKVAAIMPDAFSNPKVSSAVKSVVLPKTVRTVWEGAFSKCYNLTDLYMKSLTIELYEKALPPSKSRKATLTLHCRKECKNFTFYYYRNIAGDFDAKYKEWDG